jgi:hypothetical protein
VGVTDEAKKSVILIANNVDKLIFIAKANSNPGLNPKYLVSSKTIFYWHS